MSDIERERGEEKVRVGGMQGSQVLLYEACMCNCTEYGVRALHQMNILLVDW